VAIKVLPPDLAAHAELRERFLRETRTAAGFNHPNIVSVYSVEQVDGLFCLIMEFVDGETLTQRVRRGGPLSAPEAVRLFEETGWALAYAHSRGVVHRDVKPDNILLERATGRALITDFGIARTSAMAGLTQVGEVIGTPQFMSPEQAAGEELDGRSDLYSLGIVAFFALTGRLPFQAPSTQALLAMHLTQAAPRLASLRPDLPPDLCAVVDRCLAKTPEERFPGGEALVSEVEALRIAKPVVAPAVRLFHQQAIQVIRMSLVLVAVGAATLPRLGGGDRLVEVAFLLAGIWGLNLSLHQRARFLVRQGFSFDDIRNGFRTIGDEGAAARTQLRNSVADMRRHRRRLRVAGVTGGLGLIMAALASTYLRQPNPATGLSAISVPGLLSVIAAAIMVSLAIVSFITDPVREPRLERLSAWLWRGAAGRLLFRLAAKGIASDPGRRNGNGPTEVTSLTTGVAELVDGLNTTQRRKLGRARDQVVQLERRAADLARCDQELERGLMEAADPLAGDPDLLAGRRGEVVRELETARAAARDERALLLERLEAVRLQLVRLRAGVGGVGDVERELGA
jgi:serine/threonine-protein kinase